MINERLRYVNRSDRIYPQNARELVHIWQYQRAGASGAKVAALLMNMSIFSFAMPTVNYLTAASSETSG